MGEEAEYEIERLLNETINKQYDEEGHPREHNWLEDEDFEDENGK